MKVGLPALLLSVILLVFFYFKIDVVRSKDTIDIHLHDTYVVLSDTSVLCLYSFLLV